MSTQGTSFTRSIDAAKYADYFIRKILHVKPDEEVLIVADSYTESELWKGLASAAAAVGARWTVVIQPPWTDFSDRRKLTEPSRKAYEGADVVINAMFTFYPYPYSDGFVERLRQGKCRVLDIKNRTLRSMTGGGVDANPDELEAINMKVLDAVKDAKEIHMTSKLGTDLKIDVSKCEWHQDPGKLRPLLNFAGGKANQPDGEVWCVPKSADGVLVVDGPIAHIRESHGIWGNFPWEPLKLVAKDGFWVEVIGDRGDAERIREAFRKIKGSNVVDEFAFGTNPLCRETGEFQEEKKKMGFVHMAFGRANELIHADIVIRRPKVEVDNKVIMENGRYTIL